MERYQVMIEIGGELPLTLAGELIHYANDIGAGTDWGDTEPIDLAWLKVTGSGSEETLDLMVDEGHSLTFDHVKAFCRRNNLTYCSTGYSSTGYECGLEFWKPGLDKPIERGSDSDGQIVIPLSELRARMLNGESLTSVITYLEAGAEAVPAFRLKD